MISIENDNALKINELPTEPTPSKVMGIFLPVEISPAADNTNPDTLTAEGEKTSTHTSPMEEVSKQITITRSLVAIEQEHDQLLKSLIDNRTRLNQLLHSSNT